MNTLNLIARIVTIPGAYIKVFWERLFAPMLEICAENTGFLQNGAGAGHITHGGASLRQLMLYTLLPGAVCLVTGVPLFVFGYAFLGPFGAVPRDGGAFLFAAALAALYLGASLLANLFPTRADAKALRDGVAESKSVAVRIFGYPYALVLKVGAFCESSGLTALGIFGGLAVYFLVYLFGKV
jgi:hypothetical protein